MNKTTTAQSPSHKPRPMIDLLVSILIPSLILMKLSGDSDLGPTNALILALAFPFAWGLFELVKYRTVNLIAILGLLSVLLTGGIGLLELEVKWLAIKEAAIPAILGVVVLISTFTPYPLIRTLIYNPKVLNIEAIEHNLKARDLQAAFDQRLMNATYFLSASFAFSAVMNFILAKWIVTSPTGSAAFNEELGQMTLLSYPMIAIPSTLMLVAIVYYLWRSVHGMTGLSFQEVMVLPKA